MRDLLAARVRTSPEATALLDDDRGREWTYAELDRDVAATAGRLADCGVGAGDRVGVLMETRPAFVQLAFACQRLGATLVALNARLAARTLAEQVARAGVVLVVCAGDTEDLAREAVAGARDATDPGTEADGAGDAETPVTSVNSPASGDVTAFADREHAAFDPAEWERDDPLALLFTSGTTGDPKPVTLTVGNVVASAVASAFRLGVTPGDRWLLCLSMYHTGGLAVPLRCALYGTTCVLQRGFDAEEALRALQERDCTGVSVVPTMLRRMLRADRAFADSVRFVLTGGAPTPPELVADCENAGVPVCPSYGMTEAASQIATARPAEAYEHPDTVGRPLFGTTVTIVDGDDEPVAAGETGELCVSGPTVTPGYADAPAANAEAFGPHGLYTGDVGYYDEAGRLYVLNRRSDRIVTGGENVDPGEVAAVVRSHSGVRDVAVVGVPDEEWGERVAALVVPAGDAAGLRDALESDWNERLADFERPRTVAFVESLPRTASGTVDREAARERAVEAVGGTAGDSES